MASTGVLRASTVVVTVVLVTSVRTTRAKQEFYDAISAQTGTCADCSLCHSGRVGNGLTVDYEHKPFVTAWVLKGKPLPLPNDGADSDADGAPDVVELMQFGNPNDAAVLPPNFECPTGPRPEYGCVTVSTTKRQAGWAWVGGALASLAFARRRGRTALGGDANTDRGDP